MNKLSVIGAAGVAVLALLYCAVGRTAGQSSATRPAGNQLLPSSVSETVLGPAPAPGELVSGSPDGSTWVQVRRVVGSPGTGGSSPAIPTAGGGRPDTRPAVGMTRGQSPATRPATAIGSTNQDSANQNRVTPSPQGARGTPTAIRVQVLVNGKPARMVDEVVIGSRGPVVFSARGGHIAYVARDGGKFFVVADERPQALFDTIDRDSLRFSADGQSLTYQGARAGRNWVVVDGREFGPYAMVQGVTLAERGRRAAWIAQKEMNAKIPASVVVDGGVVATTNVPTPVVLSPDGSRWAFLAKANDAVVTKIMGAGTAEYRYPNPPVAFSPDGAHLLSEPTGPGMVVIDGQVVAHLTVPPAEKQSFAPVPFSPDGTVRCIAGDKTYLVRPNGSTAAVLAGQGTFSPSGRRVVTRKMLEYNPNLGGMGAVFDLGGGRVLKPYTNVSRDGFTADDKYFFTATDAGLSVLVVEGNPSPGYTLLNASLLNFSPDGRYVALPTGRGAEWHLTVNGHDSALAYDQVLPVPCCFEGDRVRMLAVRRGQVVQAVVALAGIQPLPPPGAAPAPVAAVATRPVPATAPASGGVALTQSPATAGSWKRSVVLPDVLPPGGASRANLSGVVIDGEPVFVHSAMVFGHSGPGVTATVRRGGKWTTLKIPDVPPECLFAASTAVGRTLYVAMESGNSGGAIHIASYTNDQWTREWDRTSKFHFGNFVSMGSVGGRPFAIFCDDAGDSATYSGRAAVAEKGADGKWTFSKLDLPYNPGVIGTSAGHAGNNATLLFRTYGGGGVLYGERVGGNWSFTPISGFSLAGALTDVNGHPACFCENAWHEKSAGSWKAQPLTDKTDLVECADVTLVGGKPAVVFFDARRKEIHYRTQGASGWSDQIIETGVSGLNCGLCLVEVDGRPVVAYIGQSGGPQTPLVCLEGK